MEAQLTSLEIVIRLGTALLAGGLLGFEREWHRKPAGLRTHMLIGLGSAAFMLIAQQVQVDAALATSDFIRLDPTRTLQGLIGGLGFIGAGTILRHGTSVQGLTTAASVWTAGALGAACGQGHARIAIVTALLALIVLAILGAVERRAEPGRRSGS